jgi:D-tyrosyl-tRNA(Tyr) deacylase
MRAVIQRVSRSGVVVDGRPVGEIGRGILVFLGVERGDLESDARYLLEKVINLRIFEDDEGKMNRSLAEVNGSLLVVSQFTLLGDVRKGRRPSFVDAEEPRRAQELYELFMALAQKEGIPVLGGVFGAMMDVSLVNDGPVTFIIDSKKRF